MEQTIPSAVDLDRRTEELLRQIYECLSCISGERDANDEEVDVVEERCEDFFAIPKPDAPLRLSTLEDVTCYRQSILNLHELRSFADEFAVEGDEGFYSRSIFKFIRKVSEKVPERTTSTPVGEADLDRDGTQEYSRLLAEWVQKEVVEKHLQKTSQSVLYGIKDAIRRGKDFEQQRQLLEPMNAYLGRLGVHTVIPNPGATYEDFIDYYEPIPVGQTHEVEPGTGRKVIESLVKIAYVLQYTDASGDTVTLRMPGQCCVVNQSDLGPIN